MQTLKILENKDIQDIELAKFELENVRVVVEDKKSIDISIKKLDNIIKKFKN